MTITAHKICLTPTPEQEDYLRRACGTRRFVYNWGLVAWNRQHDAGEKPSAMMLKEQFNAIREADYPWTYDVTKCAVEGAFFDLKDAFTRFFAGQTQYPRYKKKGKSHESFYLANDKFTVGDHWVQISVMGDFVLTQREASGTQTEHTKYKRKLGKVNLAESLPFRVPLPEGTPIASGKRRHARKQVWCQSVTTVGATVSYIEGY